SSSSTFGTSSSQASAPSISRADPWDIVRRARERRHPSGVEVAQRVCGAWHELKFSDPVFRIATAEVSGTAVVVIAGDRRAGTGRPTPASYRAAQRAMMLAVEKGVPVLTFVDMPGADPSPVSENAGIAREIARTFALMMTITVPTIAVCVGEGGSGGALAIACGDQFACCDDSFFSVIAPEGAAAILDRDRNNAPARAHDLRLTAPDLLDLGVTDAVLPAAAEISAVQVGALVEQAQPGDRQRRWDAATRRALAVEN
ncbi:MAG: carboxyl transferase domain-containing protein, partial [Acidimicrobiia bacterium]